MRISRAFIRPGMIGGNRRAVSDATLGKLRLQAKIRGGMDWAKTSRMIGEMNARCLQYCGKAVKNAAKTGIGRGKGKISAAAKKRMGRGSPVEFVGGLYLDVTAYSSGDPRAAGQPIKSWAPKRFMYKDIADFYDAGSRTVVIGTYKAAHWLAQLHQFGGTLRETAWRIGVGTARNAYLRKQPAGGRDSNGRYAKGSGWRGTTKYEYGAIRWQPNKTGNFRGYQNWERTTMTRSARYPARPYMQGSARVVEAMRKANENWRNQLKRAA